MKKTSNVILAIVMCIVLLVAIISVSAAWFADIYSRSETIVISSAKPKGAAVIFGNSVSSGDDTAENKLAPAVVLEGLVATGVDGIDEIDVTDESEIYSVSNPSGRIKNTARKITFEFVYMYVGDTDGGETDKAVTITLDKVALVDPRDESSGLDIPTYNDEFDALPSVLGPGESDVVHTVDQRQDIGTAVTRIYMELTPGVEYNFECDIWFNVVDELLSPELSGAQIFFNFEIAVAERR